MKRLGKISGIALMIVLALFDPLRAQDHVTLSVSCSIPSVPGLNAPLVEEEKSVNQKQETKSVKNDENVQETVVEENDGPHAIVKTFYSR